MKEAKRREEDIVVGYSNEGPGGFIYRPIILYMALTGAAVLGLIFGVGGFLVATGAWPIVDFGQFSASFDSVSAITAAGIGVALGAFVGGIIGTYGMLTKGRNRHRL